MAKEGERAFEIIAKQKGEPGHEPDWLLQKRLKVGTKIYGTWMKQKNKGVRDNHSDKLL